MRTQFESERKAFSDRAHEAAKRLIYPQAFGSDAGDLSFESHDVADGGVNRILDGTLGIDKTVSVRCPHLHQGIGFTTQERFRKPSFAAYNDLTITEWNGTTNLPSELYKCKAQYFVYGYFSEETGAFEDALVVEVARMLRGICTRELPFVQEINKKQQSFIAVKFEDLQAYGAVMYWQNPPQPKKKGRRIVSFEDLTELWPAVLMRIRKKIGVTAVAFLYDARPVGFTADDVILEFAKEFHHTKACAAADRLGFEQIINETLDKPRALKLMLARSGALVGAR